MVLCYTNYYLIHITFYYTLHISFYIYIFICFYTYIFIFFYGFLTVHSTVCSYGFLLLRLPPCGQPYGWLYDFLYVFLYGCLYGYLITVFSSFILYILYYPILIFLIHIHCILNTIFYYILYIAPP